MEKEKSFVIRFCNFASNPKETKSYEYWTGEKQQQHNKLYAICTGNIAFAKVFHRHQDVSRSLHMLKERCHNPGRFEIIELPYD